MPVPPPRPADSAAPADWLQGRLDWNASWVRGFVGPGYEAYARVLHPLGEGPNRPTWASVAAQQGRVMHPSAQWEQISTPPPFQPDRYQPLGRGDSDPRTGELSEEALAALCDVLANHTAPDQPCYFGVWEGWGRLRPGRSSVVQSTPVGQPIHPIQYAPDDWRLDMAGPTFHLPARTYHLFTGELHEALHIGGWVTATWFQNQSPNLIWPADHSWFVATEIDFDSTLVGGSQHLIDDLLAIRDLEVLPIELDAPYEDDING